MPQSELAKKGHLSPGQGNQGTLGESVCVGPSWKRKTPTQNLDLVRQGRDTEILLTSEVNSEVSQNETSKEDID